MSENKPSKTGYVYSLFKAMVFIGVPFGAYFILDWGVLQVLGAIFLMSMAFELDETGPIWRRWLWSFLMALVMLAGHFYLGESYIAWGLVLLSLVLILIILMILNGIREYKTGDGSTITFYVLGLIVFIPVTVIVIYNTMAAFGYV